MELIQRYYDEMWNQWNFHLADELLADDFAFRGSLAGEIRGREAFRDYMRLVRDAFSDFHNRIDQLVSSPTHGAARLTYTGTHDGALWGIPPTGRRITYPGIAIFRQDDQRLIEGYVGGDRLTLLEQVLGEGFWTTSGSAVTAALKDGTAVRSATGDDVKWCAELMASSEPWITLRRGVSSTMKLLADRNKELYIALRQEQRAGFVLIDMRGTFSGYIQSICVAPHSRNQGIGSALIRFAEERIFREQPNVFLCVSSFNVDAHRFYARQNYEKVGELRDFLIPGASEILLRKTIGSKTQFEVSGNA